MYKRILVPVDGSATAHKGLVEAVKLARMSGAALKLVHVVSEFVDSSFGPALYHEAVILDLRAAGERTLAAATTYARGEGVAAESEMIETTASRPAAIIIEAAKRWEADLIVMGTHGSRGLSRLALGSDAEMVLRSASVPALMVRDIEQSP